MWARNQTQQPALYCELLRLCFGRGQARESLQLAPPAVTAQLPILQRRVCQPSKPKVESPCPFPPQLDSHNFYVFPFYLTCATPQLDQTVPHNFKKKVNRPVNFETPHYYDCSSRLQPIVGFIQCQGFGWLGGGYTLCSCDDDSAVCTAPVLLPVLRGLRLQTLSSCEGAITCMCCACCVLRKQQATQQHCVTPVWRRSSC